MFVLCFLSALVAVLLPSFYRLFAVFSSRLTRREQHEKKRLPNLQKGWTALKKLTNNYTAMS